MKHTFKKIISACACVALSASMLMTSTVAQAATTGYFNSYSTIASIPNRHSCTAMQGMAVGSTWLYTVKIKSDESRAILSKTNRKTGEVVNLKTKDGKKYVTYLGHANDMDVTSIDGKSNLYIASMKTGTNSVVRMEIDGSYMTKKGHYRLKLNGADTSVSGIAVESKTSSKINFLFKKGCTFYRGSIGVNDTTGSINLTEAFKINIASVNINGKVNDLSAYTHQGFGYYKGKLYVPLWDSINKRNRSVIPVYNVNGTSSGTLTSDPNLSFRITSSAYSLFEIESCDISGDGKLYMNTNRSDSQDAVLCFKNYTFS